MRNEEIEKPYTEAELRKGLRLSWEDIALRPEKAVQAGDLDTKILGHFNTDPQRAPQRRVTVCLMIRYRVEKS